jgi:F0F1-type ATP synthase assembly protein I
MSDEPAPSEPNKGPNVPLGFMIAGSEMASFTILGLLLDYAFGTMPGLTIAFTLLGLVAAFFQMKRLAKAVSGKSVTKPPPPDGGGASGGGS